MFFPFGVAVTICLGLVIVVVLAARARSDDSIAHVLYDVEHPEKSR